MYCTTCILVFISIGNKWLQAFYKNGYSQVAWSSEIEMKSISVKSVDSNNHVGMLYVS